MYIKSEKRLYRVFKRVGAVVSYQRIERALEIESPAKP